MNIGMLIQIVIKKWGHHLNLDLYFTVWGLNIKGNGAYCLCRVSFAFQNINSCQTDKIWANISDIGAILPKSVKGNLSG